MKQVLSILAIIAFGAFSVQAQKVKKAKTAPVVPSNQTVQPAPVAPTVQVDPTMKTNQSGGAVMTFDITTVDYGTIEKGGEPLRKFKFTNTGTEPLIIKNAKGSCGCTVPTYPKEPCMPGESNYIEVRYDTQRVGPFTKTVTLTTNEPVETRTLTIKGDVKDVPTAPSVPVSTGGLKQ